MPLRVLVMPLAVLVCVLPPSVGRAAEPAPTQTDAVQAVGGDDLATAPPRIIVTDHPAVLLYVDGEPLVEQLKGSPFARVQNTPLPLAEDTRDGSFWLLHGGRWYHAAALSGPWAVVDKPADEVVALAAILPRAADPDQVVNRDAAGTDAAKDDGDDDATVPAGADTTPDGPPVQIVVSQDPADLISTDGPPTYADIPGSGLQAVSNSDHDLFLDPAGGQHYLLLSGRWYRSARLAGGAWAFVPPGELPAGFARIPAESPYARVLANVPGTPAAQQAVAAAQEPQTATVRRDATVAVTYDGEPQWQAIPETSLAYAVNSPLAVVRSGDRDYYCCAQGVWYRAPTPGGPWTVATGRPADIDRIPPDNPLYNVRYVYVYSSTPDYVEVGYAPGYLGSYVYHGYVVWGTGYHYRGWRGHRYYPRPLTWGFGMVYGPGGGWFVGARYGRYDHVRGYPYGGWWGPGGYRTVTTHVAYNHGTQPVGGPPGPTPPGRPEHPAPPDRETPKADPRARLIAPADDNLYQRRENRGRVVTVTDGRPAPPRRVQPDADPRPQTPPGRSAPQQPVPPVAPRQDGTGQHGPDAQPQTPERPRRDDPSEPKARPKPPKDSPTDGTDAPPPRQEPERPAPRTTPDATPGDDTPKPRRRPPEIEDHPMPRKERPAQPAPGGDAPPLKPPVAEPPRPERPTTPTPERPQPQRPEPQRPVREPERPVAPPPVQAQPQPQPPPRPERSTPTPRQERAPERPVAPPQAPPPQSQPQPQAQPPPRPERPAPQPRQERTPEQRADQRPAPPADGNTPRQRDGTP